MGGTTRAAFELLHWTGARISDAVLIGPGMIDREGVLTWRQAKTGDPAHVPWSCALPTYAESLAADRAMALEAVAARAAKVEKSAHGLRKSRAIALAELGATPHQISAWTGHRTLSEVERYTRKAERRRAVMGQEQSGNVANHPNKSQNSGK